MSMSPRPDVHIGVWLALDLAVSLTACQAAAQPSAARQLSPAQDTQPAERRGGTLTLAVRGSVPTMAPLGTATTTTGGWGGAVEIHSAPLITADYDSRAPIGRLADRVPSLADGTVSLLADGRMRVAYPLRKRVTWHDGAPFTAADLVLS